MNLRPLLVVLFVLMAQSALAEEFSIPTFEQVRASHISSDAVLLDRHGQTLTDLRIAPNVRRLDWVPLAALSPAMRDALLRAEDRRFFQHSGVDWLAFAGAAWQNLWYKGKRGASTLTMQLAGLLDPALRMPTLRGARRSYTQKWDQSRAALELEHKWSKAQILEAYLNLAPFRGDLQGVGAASQLLFGLPASQISPREAALLAALLRGPNARPALVAKRACRLSASLGRASLCGEITSLAASRLDAPRNQSRHTLAPHLARALLQHPGQRVATLLDAELQQRLLTALVRLKDPRAAAVLLDNATGEVVAWVGAVSPSEPDGVSPRRLLADWGWPVQVALALEQRQLTWASPVPLGWAVFDPRDAWAATPSWMSLRTALAGHQGGAMLYVQNLTGHEAWLERIQSLGLDLSNLPDPQAMPVELNLLQLAAAWRPFVATGQYLTPRYLVTDPAAHSRRAWRAETAFLLADFYASTGTGGWQTVWSGHAANDGSSVLVGGTDRHTLALATYAKVPPSIMRGILAVLDHESRAPAVPDGVVGMTVHFDPQLELPRREWFLRGTELSRISALPDGRRARVTFPEAGKIYTVVEDPDLRGHWVFTADASVALHWLLDGKVLSDGDRQNWLPQPGHHVVSVHGPLDQELDRVEFDIQTGDPSQESAVNLASVYRPGQKSAFRRAVGSR